MGKRRRHTLIIHLVILVEGGAYNTGVVLCRVDGAKQRFELFRLLQRLNLGHVVLEPLAKLLDLLPLCLAQLEPVKVGELLPPVLLALPLPRL